MLPRDSSTLQRHQQVLLELLQVFDGICKKHAIAYQLFAGTALGAVRHQGFIPWDDDLDIAMLRADYSRFLEVAPKELGESYYLQAEYSSHWPMFFSKLRKNGTACMERYIPRDPQTHQGIYIDIFPIDNLSDNSVMRKVQFAASKVVIAKALRRRGYLTDSMGKKLFMGLCVLAPEKLMKRLVLLPQKSHTKKVHAFFGASSRYEAAVFPRQWFEETADKAFSGGLYPVSAQVEQMLSALYGDYMRIPPPEERGKKIHGQIVDVENSYENYLLAQQKMEITEYTRSIR